MTDTIHPRLSSAVAASQRSRFVRYGTHSLAALQLFFVTMAIALMATSDLAHATQARYECNRGTVLSARFSPPGATPGQVVLTINGAPRQIVLPQVMSADGGRYAKGKTEFWIKGRDATLTRNGTPETCTSR